MRPPNTTRSPEVEVPLSRGTGAFDQQRRAVWVTAVAGIGVFVFLVSMLAGARGDLKATGYLLSVSISVALVVAALGLGHLRAPRASLRRGRLAGHRSVCATHRSR